MIVYVTSLAYTGRGEVLKEKRGNRWLIESPTGRTHTVKKSACREVGPTVRRAPFPLNAERALANTERTEGTAVPKPPEPERNPAYLAWLRRQVCARCGRSEAIEASHHVPKMGGTMGRKCSDLRALPLCRGDHRLYHSNPAKFDRDWIEEEIAKHLRRWVRELEA